MTLACTAPCSDSSTLFALMLQMAGKACRAKLTCHDAMMPSPAVSRAETQHTSHVACTSCRRSCVRAACTDSGSWGGGRDTHHSPQSPSSYGYICLQSSIRPKAHSSPIEYFEEMHPPTGKCIALNTSKWRNKSEPVECKMKPSLNYVLPGAGRGGANYR